MPARAKSSSSRRLGKDDPWGPDGPLTFLREAYRLLQQQRIAVLAHFRLSLSEYFALRQCGTSATMPSDIADAAGVTAAGATDIVDRLEERKLVRRVSHPSDRRAVLVELTPAGRRLLDRARAAQRALLGQVGRSMTSAERTALLRGLEALVRSLPSITPPGGPTR